MPTHLDVEHTRVCVLCICMYTYVSTNPSWRRAHRVLDNLQSSLQAEPIMLHFLFFTHTHTHTHTDTHTHKHTHPYISLLLCVCSVYIYTYPYPCTHTFCFSRQLTQTETNMTAAATHYQRIIWHTCILLLRQLTETNMTAAATHYCNTLLQHTTRENTANAATPT